MNSSKEKLLVEDGIVRNLRYITTTRMTIRDTNNDRSHPKTTDTLSGVIAAHDTRLARAETTISVVEVILLDGVMMTMMRLSTDTTAPRTDDATSDGNVRM